MSMTELKVSFPTEKLDALRFFMDKKQHTIEQELLDYLDKTYEKLVPALVREYLESRLEQMPAQQLESEPEQASVARERPARQTRRRREQAVAEPSAVPAAPSETEDPAEQENQGMTMSM